MEAKNLTEWRTQILQRDNKTCQLCENPGNVADHIIPRKLRPDLVLTLDNGRTLCRSCHSSQGERFDKPNRIRTATAGVFKVISVNGKLAIPLSALFVEANNLQVGDSLPVVASRNILKVIPMAEK